MSNWQSHQEQKKEYKERNKTLRDKMSGYFLDLSKIVFTTVVIGGIVPVFTNVEHIINWYIISFGVFLSVYLAIIGYKFLKDKK